MKRIIDILVKSIIILISLVSFVTVVAFVYLAKHQPDDLIGIINGMRPTPTPLAIRLKGIAVLGDSQSDEYRADDNRGANFPDTTLNWVELLAKYRNLNFGKWQYWEEPRRQGYEYNWARTGATTNSMLVSGQHTGVAEQVKKGQVNLVIVYIGANDFAPFITQTGYQAIYTSALSRAEIIEKENDILANITTAVDTIRAAGDVHMLLVTIPDWGRNIGVQIAFPNPDQRNLVTQVVFDTNRKLEQMASVRNIPIVDPNAFYDNLAKASDSMHVTVGDITMQTLLLNNDPKNIFLEDGVHLGTVMNGLFANYLLQSLNTNYGMNIKLFSTNEILSNAGLK